MNKLKVLDKTPFPWFGRKQKVAHLVWQALGNVNAYTEPFGGSAAVLLARPKGHGVRVESYNDDDGLLVNFWRAVKAVPDEVAQHCSDPPYELTKHARHKALWNAKDVLVERLRADPEWYDAKYAGWWVWLVCISLGDNWQHKNDASAPILCPDYNAMGLVNFRVDELATCRALALRLSSVRVTCGDWRRVVSSACLHRRMHGIFLDPPYSKTRKVYANKKDIAEDVARWAIAEGVKHSRRIVSCGYVNDSAHKIYADAGWRQVAWKASAGYARKTNTKERLYLSPHCLEVEGAL